MVGFDVFPIESSSLLRGNSLVFRGVVKPLDFVKLQSFASEAAGVSPKPLDLDGLREYLKLMASPENLLSLEKEKQNRCQNKI